MSAILYGHLNNPEWNVPWMQSYRLAAQHKVIPSLEYGRLEPLIHLRQLTSVYAALSDNKIADSRKRAENALHLMVKVQIGLDFLRLLPLGIAAPLREAIRTCQLSPSGEWPVGAYQLTGRNDLAEGVGASPDQLFNGGYRSVKEWLVSVRSYPLSTTILSLAASSIPPNSGRRLVNLFTIPHWQGSCP
jgi:anaphase-promoting complex subunit 1